MRFVRWIALGGLFLGGLAAAALWVYVDRVAVWAVERGATRALGVPTSVRSARVSLRAGGLRLRDLRVANPSGFEGEFLSLRDARLALDLASVREPVIRAPRLTLSQLVVRLERRPGRTNYGTILQNLSKNGKPAATAKDSPRRFLVEELRIEDVTAHVRLLPVGGRLTELEVQVPAIRLTNVGEGKGGLPVAQLSGLVVQAVLEALARKGVGLPGQLAGELQAGLARLPLRVPGPARAGESAREAVEGAGRAIREGAGRVFENLRRGGERKP